MVDQENQTVSDRIQAATGKLAEHIKASDLDAARALSAKMIEEFPFHWKAERARFRVALAEGDFKACEAALRSMADKGASAVQQAPSRFKLASKTNDAAGEFKALLVLFKADKLDDLQSLRFSELAFEMSKIALAREAFTAYFRKCKVNASDSSFMQTLANCPEPFLDAVLPEARQEFADDARIHELLFMLHAISGDYMKAVNAFSQARELDGKRQLPFNLFIRVMNETPDIQKLTENFVSLAKQLPVFEVILIYACLLFKTGQKRSALSIRHKYEPLLGTQPKPEYLSVELAHELGLFDEKTKHSSKETFSRLTTEWDNWTMLLKSTKNPDSMALLQQAFELKDKHTDVLKDLQPDKEMIVSGADRPNGTVLVFSGLGDKLSMPFNVMDVFFAELGLSAIFLRDSQRQLYCNGISQLGDDFETTLNVLKNEISSLGAEKPLYVMGNSAGGFGAIYYATQLNAEACIVFSPICSVDIQYLEEVCGDRRARILARRIENSVDPKIFDLNRVLGETKPDFLLSIYGAGVDSVDKNHCIQLEKMPRSKVVYLENFSDHNAIDRAAKEFGFLNIVRDAFQLNA